MEGCVDAVRADQKSNVLRIAHLGAEICTRPAWKHERIEPFPFQHGINAFDPREPDVLCSSTALSCGPLRSYASMRAMQ
jgi:hypothetical protein